jgi:hypothetical protein
MNPTKPAIACSPRKQPVARDSDEQPVARDAIEAKALHCESEAVISEFRVLAQGLLEEFGWREAVAMQVARCVILAYEIGVALRASRVGSGLVGEKLTIPPELLRVLYALCCEVRALTGDIRAVAQVKYAFHAGWKRNRRGNGGAPKMTAGAIVLELMYRTEKTESDARYRYRARVRLKKMTEKFHRK